MAATPAGSDKTPDPTHPLIKLNTAAEIVCSCALGLKVVALEGTSAVDAEFMRMTNLPFPPFSPPVPARARDNDFLLAAALAISGRMVVVERELKKAEDDDAVASMQKDSPAAMLSSFMVRR